MKPGMITAILAVTLLSACSSVKSKPASLVDGTSQTGLQYSAPKSMFAVKLVEVGDQILVSISDPFPVGDPNATFTLTATSGTFANQMYDFRVDDRTRVLSTVRSDSVGVLDEVLIDLGKAAGGYRATRESAYYAGAAERVLYHRIIDPMMEDDCGFAKACTLSTLGRDLEIAAQGALKCADAAEYAEKYLKKGQLLALEGKLVSSSYTDKEGNKRYSTDVHANEFMILASKKEAVTE